MDRTESADPCEQPPPSYSSPFPHELPKIVWRCIYQPSGETVFLSSDGDREFEEINDRGQKRFLGFFLTDREIVRPSETDKYEGDICWCGENSVPGVACDQRLYVKEGSGVTMQQLRRLLGKHAYVLDDFEETARGYRKKPLRLADEEPEPVSAELSE